MEHISSLPLTYTKSLADPTRRAIFERLCHEGRQTHYSAQLRALAPLIDWTSQMAGFWQGRFDQLENLLKRMDQ
jgi:hypothetical protein